MHSVLIGWNFSDYFVVKMILLYFESSGVNGNGLVVEKPITEQIQDMNDGLSIIFD